MNDEDFITDAIERGDGGGSTPVDLLRRAVFLVSELEVCCDKDGIDSFVERYASVDISLVAQLLREAGAIEIATGLEEIAAKRAGTDESVLDEVNRLVTDRAQYDYDALVSAVGVRRSRMLEL